MSDEKKLTILGHLEELRRRLLRSAVVVGVTTTICFFFTDKVIQILIRPASGIELIYIRLTEMIATYVKVALVAGIVLALPYLLYELVRFVSPALTRTEKRYFYALLPSSILFFLAGAALCYFFFLPPALNFLLNFGSDIATPLITIENYVSIVTMLLFWVGLSFEMPLVIFFLAGIGVVSPRALSRKRKWAVLGAFVLGAIITPTIDPVNQSIVAGTLVVLYEISIWLAKLAAWRRRKRPVPAAAAQE